MSCGTARSMHAATTRAAARTAAGRSSHSNRSSSCICATRRTGSAAAVGATSGVFRRRRFESARGRRGEPSAHRDLHQIRGAPLYERVDRLAFGLGAFPLVGAREPWPRPVSPRRQDDPFLTPRALLRPRHEGAHAGERAEERVDQSLRDVAGASELFREARLTLAERRP